jgi:hypothetical protein
MDVNESPRPSTVSRMRVQALVAVSAAVLLAMLFASCARSASLDAQRSATAAPPFPTASALAATPPSQIPCNDAPRGAGDASDPGSWPEVKAVLGASVVVLAPVDLPAPFTAPIRASACVRSGVPEYEVEYAFTTEHLVFCLNMCSSANGNFPPPTATQSLPLRGTTASEMIAEHSAADGSSLYEATWRESGSRYIVRLQSRTLGTAGLTQIIGGLESVQ